MEHANPNIAFLGGVLLMVLLGFIYLAVKKSREAKSNRKTTGGVDPNKPPRRLP